MPTTILPPGVMVGKTLVDTQRDYIPVRMVNLTNEPRQIPCGIEVASCEPVESIVYPNSDPHREPISLDEGLPEHLKDLYLRSANGLSDDQQHELRNLLLEFQDIFSRGPHDPGRTGVTKHKINTIDASPVGQHPRRLPFAQREEAFKAVEEMHAQGIIEPSASPWASPDVLVKKKDGGTRFCVDYWKLNELTKKDSYPLPRQGTTLDALSGSSWFSTVDLKSGYWQVEVQEQDCEKTAFTAGNGLCSSM